jgi:hypothetical protein
MEKLRREEEIEKIQFKSVYDYNETDAEKFPNKIVRAIKYLEIISKSLISHFEDMDLPEKQQIMNLMYSAPNRILYALFKPFDDKYDKIVDELYELIKSVETPRELAKEEFSKAMIEEAFSRQAIAMVLTVYDNIAFFGTNSATLQLLNNCEMPNSNYKIANLLMEENGGSANSFVTKAIKLKEDEDDDFVTNLVRLVTRKHLITKNVDYKIRERIADKVFTPSSKKQLLLTSLKGQKKE